MLRAVVFAAVIALVAGDMYLHNPPGCNDRNRERRDNRNNGNRLFDSQNNGKGGYAWRGNARFRASPDPLVYYTGSVLRLEWTNQHGCGDNPNVVCDVVLQYGCDTIADNLQSTTRKAERDLPGLRDGYPDSAVEEASDNNNAGYLRRRFSGQAPPNQQAQNQDGTNTIDDEVFENDETKRDQFYILGQLGGVEFGMHEDYDHYKMCKTTERNKGLYTADQRVNRNDARGTRQNPNGARRGLECPEERDYYPYWVGPMNKFHDIAVLTNKAEKCDFFQENSPNVRAYGWCSNHISGLRPITPSGCMAKNGTWNAGAPIGGGKPDCQLSMLSRDNHLGNAVKTDPETGLPLADEWQPESAHYLWTIPDEIADKRCVVRVRYNMSTLDYPADQYSLNGGNSGIGINGSRNCPRVFTNDGANEDDLNQQVLENPQCSSLLEVNGSAIRPLFNRPYVDVFGLGHQSGKKLSIALNTNQAGRTFQDRSYVFDVRPRPSGIDAGDIINLNTRGRRGNIVQCYPAVEYDFVPTNLKIKQGQYLHIQFHGSDFNAAKNANNGEGWQYSDRFNILQMEQASHNFPLPKSQISMFDENTALRWALMDQQSVNCAPFKNGQKNEQNSRANCGKLNQAPNRFPPNYADGLMEIRQNKGTYWYVSTRNNNFSNRSQKGRLIVEPSTSGLSSGEVAGIVVGTMAAAGVAVAGVCFFGKRNPNSKVGGMYQSCAGQCQGIKAAVQGPSATTGSTMPMDMEYQRH